MRTFALALLMIAMPASACGEPLPPTAPNIQLFQLPEGARVHDVAPAADGKIWYTAQRQGALGIIDPRTGEISQVPLGKTLHRTA